MQAGGDGRPLLSLSLRLVGRRRHRDRSAAELVPSHATQDGTADSPRRLSEPGRGHALNVGNTSHNGRESSGLPFYIAW